MAIKKSDLKIIDAKELNKVALYYREQEKKKVFNDILAFILDKCAKDAQKGNLETEFNLKKYDSITFKSYFKSIPIEWVYPDIKTTLEKYGYSVSLISGEKLIISW